MIKLHTTVTYSLPADTSGIVHLDEATAITEKPTWQKSEVTCGQQPAWKWSPQTSDPQGTEFYQLPQELESWSFRSWAFRWDLSLADTSVAVLWKTLKGGPSWARLRLLTHRDCETKKCVTGGCPGGSVVKNQPANAGDTASIPGPGRSHMRLSD